MTLGRSVRSLLLITAFLAAACGGDDGGGAGGGGDGFDVTLLQGVRGDEFYISMACGAQEAADELGVNLDVQGPSAFDATEQTQVLNGVIAQDPDALLIAPTDAKAMIAPIQQAVNQDIKVVLVDTTLEDPSIAESHIGSDNVEGGRIAGETLAKLIGEQGKVLVVNVKPGISTTDDRQEGFEQAIEQYPDIEYLGSEYSNNEPERAASIVTSTLSADPDLAGVFGTNVFSAEGAATGLRNANKLGDVAMVGFDATPSEVTAVKQGLINSLIAQKPRDIGRIGVETAVKALEGEEVEEEIETGYEIVTKKNLSRPAVQRALYTSQC